MTTKSRNHFQMLYATGWVPAWQTQVAGLWGDLLGPEFSGDLYRAVNILTRSRVTPAMARCMSDRDLLDIRRFGPILLREIRQLLSATPEGQP